MPTLIDTAGGGERGGLHRRLQCRRVHGVSVLARLPMKQLHLSGKDAAYMQLRGVQDYGGRRGGRGGVSSCSTTQPHATPVTGWAKSVSLGRKWRPRPLRPPRPPPNTTTTTCTDDHNGENPCTHPGATTCTNAGADLFANAHLRLSPLPVFFSVIVTILFLFSSVLSVDRCDSSSSSKRNKGASCGSQW